MFNFIKQKKILILAGIILAGVLGFSSGFGFFNSPPVGSPSVGYFRSILPSSNSTYEIGTSTKAFLRGTFDELCLTGDSCKTSWPTGGSGTFSWTPQSWGNSTSTTLGFLKDRKSVV